MSTAVQNYAPISYYFPPPLGPNERWNENLKVWKPLFIGQRGSRGGPTKKQVDVWKSFLGGGGGQLHPSQNQSNSGDLEQKEGERCARISTVANECAGKRVQRRTTFKKRLPTSQREPPDIGGISLREQGWTVPPWGINRHWVTTSRRAMNLPAQKRFWLFGQSKGYLWEYTSK